MNRFYALIVTNYGKKESASFSWNPSNNYTSQFNFYQFQWRQRKTFIYILDCIRCIIVGVSNLAIQPLTNDSSWPQISWIEERIGLQLHKNDYSSSLFIAFWRYWFNFFRHTYKSKKLRVFLIQVNQVNQQQKNVHHMHFAPLPFISV